MTEPATTAPIKACGACSEQLPEEAFSKKQWQNKVQRRCKACVQDDREIVVDSSSAGTSAAKKKKKKKPVCAASQNRIKPTDADDEEREIRFALSQEICGWCGKSEGTLMKCSICRNTLFCSDRCQKAAWPQHQKICDQLRQDRKAAKKTMNSDVDALRRGAISLTEASGVGSFFIGYEPANISICVYRGELRGNEQPGMYFATPAARVGIREFFQDDNKFHQFCQHMDQQTQAELRKPESFLRNEAFRNVNELSEIDQFLLSCGPLNDIDRAKFALPFVLNRISISGPTPDGRIPDIGDITVRGYNLNALEWAARRGNHEIAEWLATDPRTSVMLTSPRSAPVAWACYTNKVKLAKMLVSHGANSHATTQVVFGHKPATHLAAENGQLLALKYLVEKCGHNIEERDTLGQNIRTSLRVNNKVWRDQPGCVACDVYAKDRGVREYA